MLSLYRLAVALVARLVLFCIVLIMIVMVVYVAGSIVGRNREISAAYGSRRIRVRRKDADLAVVAVEPLRWALSIYSSPLPAIRRSPAPSLPLSPLPLPATLDTPFTRSPICSRGIGPARKRSQFARNSQDSSETHFYQCRLTVI